MGSLNRHGYVSNTPETVAQFANKMRKHLRGQTTVTRKTTIIFHGAANAVKAAWLNGELAVPANDQEEEAILAYLAS